MKPDPKTQIRWGVGSAIAAVLVVAIIALVPDPFFRQNVYPTTLDDVEGITPGVKVFFRGAEVGEVRSIALDPASRNFAVQLGVTKNWRPASCAFATVASANPFTTPRIDLVTLEAKAGACSVARMVAGCDAVPAVAGSGAATITGCKRPDDLFKLATMAVGEAASTARTANEMATRLRDMLQGGGEGGGAVDMATMARNATETLAALNSLSGQLDRSFTPGRGDIAVTLANVRKATGRVSDVDIAALNGILRETQTLVAQNQQSIADLLAETKGTAGQARVMLEGASASLVAASSNLERTSGNLDALTDRLASDPTYILRGQRYVDPPAPGANP